MSAYRITTMSGRLFDFDAPMAERISIADVAVALGNTCRFGGHVKTFYSVAEHACRVFELVYARGCPPAMQFAALHHDSHEAFTGDVPSPLKAKIKALAPGMWEQLEREIDGALAVSFGVSDALMKSAPVKVADKQMLGYEGLVLKPPKTELFGADENFVPDPRTARRLVRCWSPEQAAREFRMQHTALLLRL